VDKWRLHGPDAGHRSAEPEAKPNQSTLPRILRIHLRYDNIISPNVRMEENDISELY
jgi:hypothetical protein